MILLAAAWAAEVVAVVPFEANSVREELEPLGRAVSDMLVTDLARSRDLVVVERTRIHQVVAELELQQSGFTDPEAAAKLGRGLGATHVVVGSVNASSVGIRIDARLVDVESQRVAGAASATGAELDFFALETDVASQLYSLLGVDLVVSDTGKPTTLDAALAGGARVQAADDAYFRELKGIAAYRRERLVVQYGTGDTYVVRNGNGVGLWANDLVASGLLPPDLLHRRQHRLRRSGIVLGALGVAAMGIGTSFVARPKYSAGRNPELGLGFGIPGLVATGLAIPMIATKPKTIPVSLYSVVPRDEIQPIVDDANAKLGEELGVSERRRLELDALER